MTTKTKQEQHEIADRIADEHGCEIMPAAYAIAAISVQRRYRQGDPQDRQRIRRCLDALAAAGVNTYGWVS